MRAVASGVCLAASLCPLAAPAQVVPFGKNKVQYRAFDWHVLSGEHIDVYYYPEEEPIARLALGHAEETFGVLERRFRHHPSRRIPLVVYASDQHFEQTNIIPGLVPEGVLGFTEYAKRRVALPFRGDYAQFRRTLRHELVHAFQLSKLAEVRDLFPRGAKASPQNVHWWTEGLAEYWSGPQTTEDVMFVRDLVVTGRLLGIREFGHTQGFASYPLGAELHGYLADRFGEAYIVELYEQHWKHESFEEALAAVLDADLDRLSQEWKYALEQRYLPEYARRPPLEVGATAIVREGGANFKPVVDLGAGDSVPRLLFLSARTGYTSLYRARLDAGERGVEVVLEGERDAELESLHAYESGIDVNDAGVVILVSKYLERDALVLWDLRAERFVGRYQWPDLVGLRSPAWDPTGMRVVFEGLSTAGYSDLYTIDFETQQRTALTSDRFRDRDPDWSPDGRWIAFSSDRTPFGREGYTNLFLLDPRTGEVRVATHGRWNDLAPRWSRDGSRIAFSSDREGSYDLYAIDRHGRGRRLTAMTGGAFDPEWLPDDEGLVFVGYRDGGFGIYAYTFPGDTTARPTIDPVAAPAARLQVGGPSAGPRRSAGWEWAGLDAATADAARAEPYQTWQELSLDVAAGDALVVPGIGSAQGAQVVGSDMLGNHVLFAGLSASRVGSLGELWDDFSGRFLYLNLSHRLNFGAGVFRLNGRLRDVALDLYREQSQGGFFLASYPFSRFRRIELQLGLERSTRRDLEDALDPVSFVAPHESDTLQDLTRDGLLTTNYLSYVKDNTLWLPVGPIDGERYNLTAGLVTCFACRTPAPSTDALVRRSAMAENYILTADYRRYIRTSASSAYALRTYVFFSDGAIPGRTTLGGPHRLRGYPRYSLVGSRAWLLNQEWRFPVLHALTLAFPFGTIPLPGIQGAIFADLGSSWYEGRAPHGSWGSYGLGLRAALGPSLVLRIDGGRRFRLGAPPPVSLDGDEDFEDTFIDLFFGYNY